MTSAREQAREAALAQRHGDENGHCERERMTGSDAASDVWAEDYRGLAALLADGTIAPLKRIHTALVWIKEALDDDPA